MTAKAETAKTEPTLSGSIDVKPGEPGPSTPAPGLPK